MIATKIILSGLLLTGILQSVAPANILFLFPLFLPSHYRAFSPIIYELANKGHQITAYVHQRIKKQKPIQNLNEISVTATDTTLGHIDYVAWRNKTSFQYIHANWEMLPPLAEAALQSPELQALMLSSEKFDLVITEATFGQECFVAFGHKFSAPVINLHPLFMGPFAAQLTGQPHSFSYIPDFRLPFTDHMTTWQRVKNAFIGVYDMIGGYFYYLPYFQEPMMRKYFRYPGSELLPPLREQIANVSLHLVDSHPVMTYIRPYSPNVVDIAGSHLTEAGTLPQDLQKFMDEATEGVIYFSFGSFINVKGLPPYMRKIFVEAMKGLKQKVIWKWDEEIPDAPHIFTGSWLPQVGILTHPNCKLFITHGGFNSLVEAMSIGKPVLGIPFFADQFHNLVYYKHRGVGLEVNLDHLSVEYFTNKINQIVNTPSFTENAKQLSKIFHDEPQTSLEKAVYWVEYVIRHKGAHHLKPASVALPYYKYLLLDVIAFCVILLFSIIYILLQIFRISVKCFRSFNVKSDKSVRNKKFE